MRPRKGAYRPAVELLEDRVTPSVSLVHPIYAPDTPQDYIDAHSDVPMTGTDGLAPFQLTARWTSTATNPGPLGQGDPTTLTWRIVPDGLPIPGSVGEPTSNSNLIAFMDGIYGGATQPNVQLKPWFPLFEQVFTSWSNLTGLDYVYEPNDDNAAFSPGSAGQLGVRADVRVAGHFIDGNSNILAYNFFPAFGGDMVVDTGDNFYANLADNSRRLRNVLAHEAGHGIGLDHVMPVNGTKLMEPFANLSFDMQQHDDILAANRHYGDRLEPNDIVAAATNLGTLSAGNTLLNNVSIDDDSDTDLYRFTLTMRMLANLTLSPVGFTYLSGAQGGPPPVNFNSKAQSDLALQILGTDGTTVVASANVNGIGLDENIVNAVLPTGQYFFRISGTNDAAQLYSLTVNLFSNGDAPAPPDLASVSDTGVSNTDNLTNLDNSSASKALQFVVGGTVPGATVTLYADGTAIGAVLASGTTTTVTTNGTSALPNGVRSITARQTEPGKPESNASVALSVTIDTVRPIVHFVNRSTPLGPATNATGVTFAVTFNEVVTGVNPTEFQLARTGTVAATLSQVTVPVTAVPVGMIHNVSVSGISGNGTLGLNVVDNGSIRDLAGNPLAPASGALALHPQSTFSVGQQPRSVAVADFNLDGKPDFVVANGMTSQVTVRLGNGDGTVQAPRTFAVGSDVAMATVGDLNRDGLPDLVTLSYPDSTLSVLLGNGNGTFQAQRILFTGGHPLTVAIADVNADDRPDLIATNPTGNYVGVFVGNGDGSFNAQLTFATGVYPDSLATGDFNGDGKVDIAIGGSGSLNGHLDILLGNGNGTFRARQSYVTPAAPQSIAVGDTNGDGKLDILAVTFNGPPCFLTVYLGNGDGTVSNQQSYTVGRNPDAFTVGDINGDGHLDAIVANTFEHNLGVLLGNGNGSFKNQQTFPVGLYPDAVTLSDLNADGRPDVVVANNFDSNVGVLLNATNGSLAGQTYAIDQIRPVVQSVNRLTPSEPATGATNVTFRATFSESVTGVNPGDFQLALSGLSAAIASVTAVSGSVYDIAVNNIAGIGTLGLNLVDDSSIRDAAGNPLTALNAPAAFQNQQTFAPGNGGRYARLGDLNGDGKLDLIFAGSALLGNGNGTFQTAPTFGSGDNAISIAVGDVNGDGKLDLITGHYISDLVMVRLGNGNGTFQQASTFFTGRRPESVALGDVNGDGNLDLAVANRLSNTAGILLGNGNGTFQVQQTFATGLAPACVTWGDFNGDDKLDLAVLNGGSDKSGVPAVLSVLLGNGNGTFQPQQTSGAGGSPHPVRGEVAAAADFNGDDKLDFALTNVYSDTVSVLLGNGNGSFQARQSFATGDAPVALLSGDVNGDGKPDLVVTDYTAPTLSVLLGNGNGTFQVRQTFAGAAYTVSVALGDVNEDGKPDLVVAQGTPGLLLNAGNGNFTGQTYAVTAVAPFVSAIGFWNPLDSTTSAASVTFRVVFSKGVTGVDPSDFQLLTTGTVATTQLQVVPLLDTHYNVIVSGITGNGKLGLNLIDNDSIRGSTGTPLGAPNNSPNGDFTGPVYTIKPPAAPFVEAIGPWNPLNSTTSAASVTFRVVFSKAVTGVDPTDFQLFTTGTVATTQLQVVPLLDTHYNVVVSGITGNGKLGLNLIDNDSIRDLAGTPLGDPNNAPNGDFTGQAYNIKPPAAPFVSAIGFWNPLDSTTSATSVTFRVVFSEAVAGVDPSDFQLYTTGTVATTQLQVVPLLATHYNVVVSGITGNGKLGLNLIDNDSIRGSTGTPLGDPNNAPNGDFTGPAYNIKPPAAPFVSAIGFWNPLNSTTSAASVTFRVVFSEAVTGVDPSDFQLYTTGTVATTQLQVVPLLATHYNVVVSGITGSGKLGLNLVDNDSIRGLTGTPLGDPNNAPDGSYAGPVYNIVPPGAGASGASRAAPGNTLTAPTDLQVTGYGAAADVAEHPLDLSGLRLLTSESHEPDDKPSIVLADTIAVIDQVMEIDFAKLGPAVIPGTNDGDVYFLLKHDVANDGAFKSANDLFQLATATTLRPEAEG